MDAAACRAEHICLQHVRVCVGCPVSRLRQASLAGPTLPTWQATAAVFIRLLRAAAAAASPRARDPGPADAQEVDPQQQQEAGEADAQSRDACTW